MKGRGEGGGGLGREREMVERREKTALLGVRGNVSGWYFESIGESKNFLQEFVLFVWCSD